MKSEKLLAVRTSKTIYREGDRVFKVFDENFSKSDILNEALNQARVEETGLAIPKILEITKVDGKWAIVMEFIPGKSLEQLMQENPQKYTDYMNQFVDIQLDVHSRRCPLLNKLKDKMYRKLNEATLDHTLRYDLQTRLDSLPKHDKVLHGDFNPSNIIIHEKDGTPYILDWSHATQGNASADAARTYLVFWLAGDIKGAEVYLDTFCTKANIVKSYVLSWLPIVAASQSVKGKPEEREFLLHWASVCDYQ